MYQATMEQYKSQILPKSHAKSRMVQRVLDRLVPHSGIEDAEWVRDRRLEAIAE